MDNGSRKRQKAARLSSESSRRLGIISVTIIDTDFYYTYWYNQIFRLKQCHCTFFQQHSVCDTDPHTHPMNDVHVIQEQLYQSIFCCFFGGLTGPVGTFPPFLA